MGYLFQKVYSDALSECIRDVKKLSQIDIFVVEMDFLGN